MCIKKIRESQMTLSRHFFFEVCWYYGPGPVFWAYLWQLTDLSLPFVNTKPSKGSLPLLTPSATICIRWCHRSDLQWKPVVIDFLCWLLCLQVAVALFTQAFLSLHLCEVHICRHRDAHVFRASSCTTSHSCQLGNSGLVGAGVCKSPHLRTSM